MRQSNYDKFPTVHVPDTQGACDVGQAAIVRRLQEAIEAKAAEGKPCVLAVDCYPGVDVAAVKQTLADALKPAVCLDTRDAMQDASAIEALVQPFVGGDDPVFGRLADLDLPAWFDAKAVDAMREAIHSQQNGLVLVCGTGATHIAPEPDVLVFADLARWEIQQRFRRGEVGNLGLDNADSGIKNLYKRAFFIDWRVADRWKLPLMDRVDFWLDTHDPSEWKLASGEAVQSGLRHTLSRPFRVVPFFDPAPWGGQWMRDKCDLPDGPSNYGWCFDCVPEENSLLLGIDGQAIELPSINLVLRHPEALLGQQVHKRFGAEFPIRFDFLDTVEGGHLSFQVHPLTAYIQEYFGMAYTQDESYYMLDAEPGATVYLGLKEGVDPEAMAEDLQAAQRGEKPFDAEAFANQWPAQKHDHFLIPAGTVHCSGQGGMVLEISATPYIFTFKLWDWGRLGLDGLPRPIHLDHGLANIQWDRTTDWVQRELINAVVPLGHGPGWREERTGLHATEFIETRRHWFTEPVDHDTNGTVNVLNLVEGSEAVVESPTGAFEPFTVHYAETFIVPAAVGAYRIRPVGADVEKPHATLKAFVKS